MAKLKRSCEKCANRVGDSFCTMRKDMQKAKSKLCDGFKVLPPKIKEVIIEKPKRPTKRPSEGMVGRFGEFLRNGGRWSFNKKPTQKQ